MATELLTFPAQFYGHDRQVTSHFGPPEDYRGHVIRKNLAGSYDAIIDGVIVRQTVGRGGAVAAIDAYADNLAPLSGRDHEERSTDGGQASGMNPNPIPSTPARAPEGLRTSPGGGE